MRIEGVTFAEEALKGVQRDEFIKMFIDSLWTDRSAEDRRTMLNDAYCIINGQGLGQ